LSINSTPFISHNIPGGGSGVYDRIGNDEVFNDFISSDNFVGSQNLLFNINYNKNSGVGKGYLDFFSFTFEDNLIFNSNYLSFRNFNSRVNGVVQYNINLNTSSQVRVWDITDLNNISEPSVETLGQMASFKFVSGTDTVLREFIAFSGTSFPSPSDGEKIPNQNISANNTPDFLIITHPLFKNQANKLADYRREHDKMDVVVATTEEVYNEFSSGKSDLVAIRDCAKMFNDKIDAKLKYLLLLGDCSYDYKNIKGLSSPQNFVPIYESEESLMPTETYSSDDYVGLLSNQEGAWLNYSYDLMEIGIGRLPVSTAEEAEGIVQKIIHYSSPVTLGQWRQNLTFIADNEEGNEFLDNAESLSTSSNILQNNYNTKKVYLASYAHEQGFAPQANLEIAQQFENGTLIMNYIGHGGEKQLASENVINTGTISALSNFDKLPFMVTATCDFGKYDDPTITSGGELFVFNPNGGAIGILCTTRPVFQNYNKRINRAFYDYVFTKNSDGSSLKLGELIKLSKNNSLSGVFNRNFALLGDPSLTLAYPENNIEITKINDKPFVPYSDTLKAQSKVSISGKITRNGVILSDFNGVLNALIFDKSTNVNTIEEPKYSFDVRDSKIFDGSASVKNGEFSFTFIVPKNINYIVGNGKVLLYANLEDGRMNDAGGGDSQILVGGGDKNSSTDNTPPQIKAYLNDESFVSGGIANENPLLIVKLYDESGISTIGDMGKSISAVINNNLKNEIKLDSYYKSDRDTYKSGTIKYKLSSADGINEGFNSIKIKAFDTFENGVENGSTIEFNVANHQNLTIKNLLNYPNPFTTNTVFHFDHNRAGDDLDILLQVYTVTGKLVKSLSSHTVYAHTHISDLVWDGKDDYGDNIGRGVYVYKLSVKALSDGFRKDEYQKLVILN
ncbi:MAG: type IX secretion system sortase PorU, partial [Opitutaceae bacterium]|nr:type IX secretion system sortase PorU [Cytophagales bacterium]